MPACCLTNLRGAIASELHVDLLGLGCLHDGQPLSRATISKWTYTPERRSRPNEGAFVYSKDTLYGKTL